MRGNLPHYEMKSPKDLKEALVLLHKAPGTWRPFAGGTDLMVLLEAGQLSHHKFINIWNLHDLKGIHDLESAVMLGALTTYGEIRAHPLLTKEYPLLCEAARETGAIAIQSRGTLGGNVANASPAADSPPALLVYDAEIELISTAGARRLHYKDFHLGYKKTQMRPDELIYRIILPRTTAGMSQYYRKVGTRKAQAISKVCFAGLVHVEKGIIRDVRIALGSVAPTAIRCPKTEMALRGRKLDSATIHRARDQILKEIAPIDDIRSTADYRQNVVANLLEDFLNVELDRSAE